MTDKRIHAGLLLQWAIRNFSDKPAAVCKGRALTFRQLDEAANRLANALLGFGLQTGDRVAVLLHNSLETLIATQAIERAGLAFVRLHPPEALEVRDYILKHSDARVMLLDARFVAEWKQSEFGRDTGRIEIAIPSTAGPGVLSFDQLCATASPADPNVPVSADDVRAIGYTSGTTGRPKGIVYTCGAWLNRLRNDFFNQDIVIDHRDVLLSAAPLTHAAGVVATPYLIKGATNIILEKFDAGEMLATIERERVTAFFVVPTMMTRLVNHPKVREYDYRSLRRIYYASAPMSVEVLRQAIDIFGARVLRQHYAIGEHPQPVTLLYPSDHDVGPKGSEDPVKLKRLGSVGRLCIGSELKLVDEGGQEVALGEAGEIRIRGDAGMNGYWKDPELTAETLVDGWIRTGDVGRMDADGYLFLVDRMKDMIISGGFNIYPREIERVIESHPSVLEVCVFGIPDDEWGEAVKAVVVLKDGAHVTAEELMDYCRQHLSAQKKPKSVDFVSELPKNATGKVLRRALRDPYRQGRERKI